jgi:hypothetical protein
MSTMRDASASGRELLGKNHPLVRVDEAITVVLRQAIVCAAFLLASVAAAYPDIKRAAWFVGSAAAVEFLLLVLAAVLRHQRHTHARTVIIECGPLHLPCVRSEIARLSGHEHRARLAGQLRRAIDDAERWHSLLVASRPPVGVLELLPYAALIREVADHLDTSLPSNVRGIALADRLLGNSYASPLYAGDGCRIGCALRQIRYELDNITPPDPPGPEPPA